MGFDITDILKDVPTPDTDKQQIQYIPIDQIDPDPDNFYSLDGLNELAGSIEMLGLQQPLLVRPAEGGRFTVISGHRRRAAILLIRDGGSTQFADGVPCIVDRSNASAALQELKLIMANSDTRKMSSADQNTQAERIEDLLRQLEDEGFEFPGRLRDWVAKLSGMSRTKLARLKVIREKLDKPLLKSYYSKGRMNEAVAYALAQRPVEMQRRICDAYQAQGRNLSIMSADFVTDYAGAVDELAKRKCKINKGGLCINRDRILEKRFDGTWGYKPCNHGHCCADCDQYLHCRSRCPLMDEKAKKERTEKREASKDQKAAEKAAREADIRNLEHVWFRFGQALAAAGLTDKQLRKMLKTGENSYNEFETYVGKDKAAALLDYSCTDTKATDAMPFYYGFKADDYRRLCAIADALDCSLDYLFCRTEVPEVNKQAQPVTNPEKREISLRFLGWLTGTAPGGVKCWARFMGDDITQDFIMMATYDAETDAWFCGDSLSKMSVIDQKCIGWWPLPDENALDLPADLTPQPVPVPDTAPNWQDGYPKDEGWYVVKTRIGNFNHVFRRVLYWAEWKWWKNETGEELGLDDHDRVICWYPLPPEAGENDD